MKIIKISNLVKKYRDITVLDIDECTFREGNSYLLLGENGSGKSTLIKLILFLIKANKGKIKIDFNRIGYIPENVYLPSYLTVKEFLLILSKIRKVRDANLKINEQLTLWNLKGSKLLSHLSKGMVRKLIIIQSLLHNPDLLIFDEPINGLDIKSQNIFYQLINNLREDKKTILVTTHYKHYYNNLYDKLLYLQDGKIYEECN